MAERNWQADWERCKKATPEPWHVVVIGYHPDGEAYCVSCTADTEWGLMIPVARLGTVYDAEMDEYVNVEVSRKLEDGLSINTKADAEFVAEAREALPYWLQRVKELEAKWLAETEEKIRLRYDKTQLDEENAKLRARARELEQENEQLRAEAKEWVCDACPEVFPTPPDKGLDLICPKCRKGLLMPKVQQEYMQRIGRMRNMIHALEAENAKLRRVLEAAGITVNDAMIIERHLSEMGEGAKWTR